MKRKFIRVLLTLVLVLSFSLVTATPVAASPGTLNVTEYTLAGTNGTSVWSTAQAKTGSSSVLLTHDTNGVGSVHVEITPPTGVTLATFQTSLTDYSFWWSMASATVNGPQFELKFEESGGSGWLEVTAVGLQNVTASGLSSFSKETLAGSTLAGYGGWGEAGESGSFFNWDPLTPLSGIEAAVNSETNVTNASAWVLTRVRVELWEATTLAAHIDDIEIAGVTYYGLIQDAIDSAVANDTISVAAGTYSAEITWPIVVDKALIVQGAGASTTTIDPAGNGQGVIAISAANVTIDGFTITGGSQAYSPSNPQEHAVWVAANYSTIKNNTIINYLGQQAGLYIGGRNDPGTESTAIYSYNVSTPLGHTIQDNSFRQVASGEGWGIYAYDLTDSLIKGNTFAGDSDDRDATGVGWTNNEGAPGTGIIIVNATAGLATGSPGGGYVVIEDNTAQYIKYSWLSFIAMYPYNDSTGFGYEQPVVSEVDKVIVRDNTAYEIAQRGDHASWSRVVKFSSGIKSDAYGIKGASLTIGSNKVTFTGNQFYDGELGFEIGEAEAFSGGTLSHAGVLDADNIEINYNLIYDMSKFGVENAALNNTVGTVGQAAKTINAESNWWNDIYGPTHTGNPYDSLITTGIDVIVTNYVDYSPWMIHTVLASGWNIYSPPWAPDTATNTPDEALDIIGTDSTKVNNAYYFDSSGTPQWKVATSLTPLTAIYLEMSAAATIDVAFSPSYTAPPSRTMYQGWNLIGPAAYADMDVDDALGDAYWGTGEANLVGYNHVESLAINQTAVWTFLRPAVMYSGDATPPDVIPTEGYWVYMVNQGTLGGFTYTPIAITTQ